MYIFICMIIAIVVVIRLPERGNILINEKVQKNKLKINSHFVILSIQLVGALN